MSVCPDRAKVAYKSLDDLVAAGCVSLPGTCAFCAYAQKDGQSWPPAWVKTGMANCKDTHGDNPCKTRLNDPKNVNNMGKTVCFDNPTSPWDRLCIFTAFETGNSNVEHMNPATRVENLTQLINDAKADGRVKNNTTLCFHNGNTASVPWTHMHAFDQAAHTAGPENMCANKSAYCTLYLDEKDGKFGAAAAARDINNLLSSTSYRPPLGCPSLG